MKVFAVTLVSIALLLGDAVGDCSGAYPPKPRRAEVVARSGTKGLTNGEILDLLQRRQNPGGEAGDSSHCVAFTAVRTTDTEASTSYDTRLPFEKTLTLLPGTSFDLDTGTFTCTEPGTYVFMFSALKNHPSDDLFVFLRKNGDILVTSISTDASYYEQVSGSAVLELETGDTVYLTYSGKAFSGSWQQTTLSGFLLYPE